MVGASLYCRSGACYIVYSCHNPEILIFLNNSSFASNTSLKLTELAELALRSKLTTIVTSNETTLKAIAKSIVDNFVNSDNFERSENPPAPEHPLERKNFRTFY